MLATPAYASVGWWSEDRSTVARDRRRVHRSGHPRWRALLRTGCACRPHTGLAGSLLAGERVAHPRSVDATRLLSRAPIPTSPAHHRTQSPRTHRRCTTALHRVGDRRRLVAMAARHRAHAGREDAA